MRSVCCSCSFEYALRGIAREYRRKEGTRENEKETVGMQFSLQRGVFFLSPSLCLLLLSKKAVVVVVIVVAFCGCRAAFAACFARWDTIPQS